MSFIKDASPREALGKLPLPLQHVKESSPEPAISSSFIAVVHEDEQADTSPIRRLLRAVLYSNAVEATVIIVIMFNFMLICMETNAKARHEETSGWVSLMSDLCFLVFFAELAMRIFVEGRQWPKNPWNWLDATIVGFGSIDFVLLWSGSQDIVNLSPVRVMRLCRLLRVVRFIWRLPSLRELRKILQMLQTCFVTLLWSFLLLGVTMTVWAVIAVETVHPIVERLGLEAFGGDCERCPRSYDSVLAANISLFQTIIAGDSWGKVSIPVMEDTPWTAFVFVGSLLTLIFGVMNLIVAVVVDTFAEIRSKDMVGRAIEMDCDEVQEKTALKRIFAKIDTDGNGSLSLQELEEGARRVVEFRHWLRVLDIDTNDLHQLFQIVDADGSGEIDPFEFIEAMYRMKNTDAKSATRFVKHMVSRMDTKQGSFENKVDEMQTKVKGLETTVESCLKNMEEKSHDDISEMMRKQEADLERSIEVAMSKVSAIALEAAYEAAALTAKRVMLESSDCLTEMTEDSAQELLMQRQDSDMVRVPSQGTPTNRGEDFRKRLREASVKAVGQLMTSEECYPLQPTRADAECALSVKTASGIHPSSAPGAGRFGPRGAPTKHVKPFVPLGCQSVPEAPDV